MILPFKHCYQENKFTWHLWWISITTSNFTKLDPFFYLFTVTSHFVIMDSLLLLSYKPCIFVFSFWKFPCRCSAQEDEEETHRTLLRRTTIGNGHFFNFLIFYGILVWVCWQYMIVISKLAGPPEAVFDWTREHESGLSNQNNSDQVFSRKHWRLVRCQNGILNLMSIFTDDHSKPRHKLRCFSFLKKKKH